MSRSVTRMWPLALALAGIVMLGISAYRWATQETGEEHALLDEPPPEDAQPDDTHFEEVKTHEIDVYETFRGVVQGEGKVQVRAPAGMRVPVVKIHHEMGEFVSKGDPLISLDRESVERAIEQATKEKRWADKERFEGYLEHVVLRAPHDAQVFEITTNLGEVPFDKGIALMTLTRKDTWSFKVLVPSDLTRVSAYLGAEVKVELDADVGLVDGVVTTHGGDSITIIDVPEEVDPETGEERGKESVPIVASHDGIGGFTTLVIGLKESEGLEPRLAGRVRLKTSTREVGLVPKKAIEWRGEVPIVRVWEPEDSIVAERTLDLGEEVGDAYVVNAGVFPGQHIVVPGAR